MLTLQASQLAAGEGRVAVELSSSGQRAVLSDLAFSYPLKLMPPKISGGDSELANRLVCLYMLTYGMLDASVTHQAMLIFATGGGLVSGDSIDLAIKLAESTNLVLLTQGNTKVFRDRPGGTYRNGSQSRSSTYQRMKVEIASNACLFLLPAPVACFERASYSQHQSFHLQDTTSSLLLLDWFTSGRLSRGESWLFDRYRSSNEIFTSSRRHVNDVLLLERAGLAGKMGDYACYCNLFICGPALSKLREHFSLMTDNLTQYKRVQAEALIWSYSELEAGRTAIVRCAGQEPESVKDWLASQLVSIRALIGHDMYKAAFV